MNTTIKVHVCRPNLRYWQDLYEEILQTHPHVQWEERDCLCGCFLCACYPYAVVNGRVVRAKNKEELRSSLLHRLQCLHHPEPGPAALPPDGLPPKE